METLIVCTKMLILSLITLYPMSTLLCLTIEIESDKLYVKFITEQIMADRIIGVRTTLRESLEKLGSPLSWEHVTKQVITKSF